MKMIVTNLRGCALAASLTAGLAGCGPLADGLDTKDLSVLDVPQRPEIVDLGINALRTTQSADRSSFTVELLGEDSTIGTVDVFLGEWRSFEEFGESWESPVDFVMNLSMNEHTYQVWGVLGSTPQMALDGFELTSPEDITSDIRAMNTLLSSVAQETSVRELLHGARVSAGAVLLQASTGTAYHQFTKKLQASDPVNNHYYDFTYLADPQWTQTYGGWDCFFNNCYGGYETKRVYHFGQNQVFTYFALGAGNNHTQPHSGSSHSVF